MFKETKTPQGHKKEPRDTPLSLSHTISYAKYYGLQGAEGGGGVGNIGGIEENIVFLSSPTSCVVVVSPDKATRAATKPAFPASDPAASSAASRPETATAPPCLSPENSGSAPRQWRHGSPVGHPMDLYRKYSFFLDDSVLGSCLDQKLQACFMQDWSDKLAWHDGV
nr:hypothetical protein Iba_chr10cCG9610 [Ipomoea batatas]